MGKTIVWAGILLLFCFRPIIAQKSDDSSSYLTSKKNDNKIRLMLMEADRLESEQNYIDAFKLYTQAGKIATAQNRFDYASEIYIRAINLRKKHNIKVPAIYSDRNLAYLNLTTYLRSIYNEECIKWIQDGIKQCKEDRDTLTMLKLYKNYYIYYDNINDLEMAEQINNEALPIFEAFGDTVEFSKGLLDHSDLLNKKKRYDDAHLYADKGYELIHSYEMSNNTVHQYKWSLWFIQLKAFIYYNQGNLKKSEQYYSACLDSISDYVNRGGIDHADLAYITKIRLGILFVSFGNFKEAEKLFVEAEQILNDPKNVGFNKIFLYTNMLETYQKAGLYREAFETSEKYRDYINDSYEKADKEKKVYKKDIATLGLDNLKKEIDALEEQANRQAKEVYLYAGIFTAALIAGLLFMFYRRQGKSNKQLMKMNKTIADQRDEITSSIEYAKKIQKAILPSNELMKICLPFSFVYYRPRDIVSGDFYWVHSVGEKVLVACADSTGHGVPGAIVSMIGNNGLNTCVNEYGLSKPAQILDALSKYVEETFEKSEDTVNDGMDIALCLIDFEKNELEYAGANTPLYCVKGNELEVVKPDKQPIGRFEYRKPFTNHVISLEGVDNVYMCSDGIQDQFGGAKGKKFKIRRLKRLLVELSQQNIYEQQKLLNESFLDWKEDEEQVDDVCFIGIQVKN